MTGVRDKAIQGVYIVDTSGSPLMMRSEPSTTGTVMAQLKTKTEVISIGFRSDKWYDVIAIIDGVLYQGFCHSDYLTKKEELNTWT